ncbi:MAG: SAM-dependent methyltransferase [Microbacterium sp.]
MSALFSAAAYGPMSAYVRPASERLLRALGDAAPEGGGARRLLFDIGCGDGNLAVAAAVSGWETIGIDVSESQVVEAGRRAAVAGLSGRTEFRTESEEVSSLPRDTADAVGSAFGIVFAADPAAAVARMAALARPGGSVGLTTWTTDAASSVLRRVLREHAGPSGDRVPDLPAPWEGGRELARALHDAGAADIRVVTASLETTAATFADALAVMGERAAVLSPLLEAAGERIGPKRIESVCREALDAAGVLAVRGGEVVVRDRYLVAAGRRR